MSGVFDPANRPALAGSYFKWEAEQDLTLPPSIGGIIAIPQTSNWGPIRTTVLFRSFAEYTEIYGTSDTPLRRAVYGAFKGEGRPGRGGAGAVIAFRMGTSASAPATLAINNTAGSPVLALTLTALHHGTRANAFRATTQPGTDAGTTDLLILDGALVVEKYNFVSAYAAGDAAALVADINARSKWFGAVAGATGTALAAQSAAPFTGGNDGSTLTSAEWLAAWDAFDSERWSLISPSGMTDSGIRASFVAWIKDRNLKGRRSMAVIGGAAGESLATANARSTAVNDWEVVNLGVGTLFLDDLGVSASTAEFAPRVAGAIANRGEARDLIYARFADVSLTTDAPTSTDEEDALAAGTTVFARDTNTVAPVFIREGVTTYSDDSQSPVVDGVKTHPVRDKNGIKVYAGIKNVRIQHGIEIEVDDWFTAGGVAGDLPVNDRVRAQVLGFITTLYQRREDAEIVQPGWAVGPDPQVAVSDDDDAVCYLHGFRPTRSLRLLLNRAKIG